MAGGAERLLAELKSLDSMVSEMLSGWQGSSGSAYTSAWELWHRGVGEVQVGLSMMARLLGHAGTQYAHQDETSAGTLGSVAGG